MNIFKDSIVDLLATIAIVISVFYQHDTYLVILWVYSALILIGKITVLFIPTLVKRASKVTQQKTPTWVYHIFYALSSACFIYIQHWYLAGIWLTIWALSSYSFYSDKKKNS